MLYGRKVKCRAARRKWQLHVNYMKLDEAPKAPLATMCKKYVCEFQKFREYSLISWDEQQFSWVQVHAHGKHFNTHFLAKVTTCLISWIITVPTARGWAPTHRDAYSTMNEYLECSPPRWQDTLLSRLRFYNQGIPSQQPHTLYWGFALRTFHGGKPQGVTIC